MDNSVCIIGQGFVGLPLALSFSLNNKSTIGVDINKQLVDDINNGITYNIEDYKNMSMQEILKIVLKENKYKAVTDISEALKECNVIILTVGIPINNGIPLMDLIINATIEIGKNLKKEDLVLVRSTVITGTTEDVLLPILERESGLIAGVDFYLAYSSERIAEGKAFEEFENMPTAVAGINDESLKKAIDVLKIICKAEIIKSNSIKVIETSKIFENVQRDVNIAMSQEFARFTEKLDIDIFEVINVANTHKRVNLLTPGPGVGGYCIPNAYYYLQPKADEFDVDLELLRMARNKNKEVPKIIVLKILEMIKAVGKKSENAKVTILGLAMKDYSSDDRTSPAIDIANILIKEGIKVEAYDSMVTTEYLYKTDNLEKALKKSDAVLLLTRQKEFDNINLNYIAKGMNKNPIFLDTKGIVNRKYAEESGFKYWKI